MQKMGTKPPRDGHQTPGVALDPKHIYIYIFAYMHGTFIFRGLKSRCSTKVCIYIYIYVYICIHYE